MFSQDWTENMQFWHEYHTGDRVMCNVNFDHLIKWFLHSEVTIIPFVISIFWEWGILGLYKYFISYFYPLILVTIDNSCLQQL